MKWQASGPHAPSEHIDTITQEELDVALKRRRRLTPEARHQREKAHWYWHELYVEGGRERKMMVNDSHHPLVVQQAFAFAGTDTQCGFSCTSSSSSDWVPVRYTNVIN